MGKALWEKNEAPLDRLREASAGPSGSAPSSDSLEGSEDEEFEAAVQASLHDRPDRVGPAGAPTASVFFRRSLGAVDLLPAGVCLILMFVRVVSQAPEPVRPPRRLCRS